jgi:hypothetical protein
MCGTKQKPCQPTELLGFAIPRPETVVGIAFCDFGLVVLPLLMSNAPSLLPIVLSPRGVPAFGTQLAGIAGSVKTGADIT